MVDDGASACITNDKNDFIGTPKTISRKVLESMDKVKQHTEELSAGQLKMIHVFTITGAYFVPTLQQGSFHLNTWCNKLKITIQEENAWDPPL